MEIMTAVTPEDRTGKVFRMQTFLNAYWANEIMRVTKSH
jgi:hypothetical protein